MWGVPSVVPFGLSAFFHKFAVLVLNGFTFIGSCFWCAAFLGRHMIHAGVLSELNPSKAFERLNLGYERKCERCTEQSRGGDPSQPHSLLVLVNLSMSTFPMSVPSFDFLMPG
jgi:hypothetical protein